MQNAQMCAPHSGDKLNYTVSGRVPKDCTVLYLSLHHICWHSIKMGLYIFVYCQQGSKMQQRSVT
jgi:hypothetical protein